MIVKLVKVCCTLTEVLEKTNGVDYHVTSYLLRSLFYPSHAQLQTRNQIELLKTQRCSLNA